jgi:predicted PurR-regulated permease PerM
MDSFWEFFWLVLVTFAFVAYLMILFQILTDMFRDHKLSGWLKAVWIIFLIIVPFLTAFIYIIARGKGMTERAIAANQAARESADAYIKSVAGGGATAAEQIHSAKALLDSGAISQAEFDQLKAKALA